MRIEVIRMLDIFTNKKKVCILFKNKYNCVTDKKTSTSLIIFTHIMSLTINELIKNDSDGINLTSNICYKYMWNFTFSFK